MSYIFQQKANLKGAAWQQPEGRVVFIVEPEEEMFGLYKLHLEQREFAACHCPSLAHLWVSLESAVPHLVIISGDLPEGAAAVAAAVLKAVRKLPGLPMVTVSSNASPEEVKLFMEAGVRSHINRKFGRLKDIVDVAKTILNNPV